MAFNTFVVFAGNAEWRVAARGDDGEHREEQVTVGPSLGDTIPKVRAALDELGHRGEPILLAVPSDWCLCATISLDKLPRSARRTSMTYRLEERLPLAAEEFVAAFIEFGDLAVGVCCPTARLRPIIDGMESAGLVVQSVCPTSLLALQSLADDSTLGERDVCLWQHEGGMELFFLSADRPTHWHVLGTGARGVAIHFGARAMSGRPSKRAIATGVNPELVATLRETCGLEIDDGPAEGYRAAAVRAAASALIGTAEPWIDLRQGQLAAQDPHRQIRRPLNALVAASVLLVTCACGAMLWRAHRYEQLTRNYENRQLAVFRAALPRQTPPANLRMRLASEELKLRATCGETSDMPPPVSALAFSRSALLRMPPADTVRYRLTDIDAAPGRVTMRGQVRAYNDVSTMAAALKQDGMLRVDQVDSDQGATPGAGVSFSLALDPAPARVDRQR